MTKHRGKLLPGRQQLWVLVVGVLFAADFVFYGYMPSHRRLQALARARDRQEQVIDAATARSEALPILEQRYKEMARLVRRYDNYVPTESALGVFLRQVPNIMTEHELRNQVMVPKETIQVGELSCIPVQMNCTGTLDGLFGFFNDLSSLRRLVRIEQVTLRNDSGYAGSVTMQTEAVIFCRPQKLQGTTSQAGDRLLEMTNDDA
ncbi:MAG: type 4a pilus biogenesis protein PilO [Phycisphaerales bacterium]|nr:MAG: type 4a pilus biogenesis protein PilO [Phycisphaerales bacterium]